MAIGLLLSFVALGAQAPVADRVTCDPLDVDGKSTPVTFPLCGLDAPDGPSVEFGGLRYLIDRTGTLSAGRAADGGWGEYVTGYQQFAKTAARRVWKEKVFIHSAADFVAMRKPGSFAVRRGGLEAFQISEIKESLARFAAIVKGKTQGAVDVQFSVEVDSEPIRASLAPGGSSPMGNDFVQRVVGPRINEYDFRSDDRVYRGPYDGVFLIHAGLVDPVPLTSTHRTPVSAIPYYTQSVLADGDRLTLSLYASWVRQLSWRMNQLGYRLPVLKDAFDDPFTFHPSQFMAPGMWTSTPDAWPQRHERPTLGGRFEWGAVGSDPLAMLPMANAEQAQQWFGSKFDVNERSNRTAFAAGATSRMMIPLGKMPVLGALTPSVRNLRVVGFVPGETSVWIMAEAAGAVTSELALLNDPATIEAAKRADEKPGVRDFGGKWVMVGNPEDVVTPPAHPDNRPQVQILPEGLGREGIMTVERTLDADHGPIYRVGERGNYRSGVAHLWGDGVSIMPLVNQPVLTFQCLMTGRDPFAIQLGFANGQRAWVVLGEAREVPVGTTDRGYQVLEYPVGVVNQWTRISIDLTDLMKLVGDDRLVSLSVTPEPYYEFFERQTIEAARFELTVPVFSNDRSALTQPGTSGSADMLALLGRLAAIGTTMTPEQATDVATALDGSFRRAKLAAADVLTRVPAPEMVPNLIENMKGGSAWVATFCARAIAFQNQPDGWAALRRALEVGPFDHTRLAAIEQISKLGDASYAGSLSVAYASKSWAVRKAAVEALGQIHTREANIIALTFLRESEPAVRLAVVAQADPTFDLAARRMLYAAVNDPSEEVRAMAAVRLIGGATDAAIRTEAIRSTREDSPYVRRVLLEFLIANPTKDAEQVIGESLDDVDPEVRVAAIAAWAKLPQPNPKALDPVRNDPDPRVQEALKRVSGGK